MVFKHFPFEYTIKTHRQSRNIRITIGQKGKVIVTKPWLVPTKIAEQFLESKISWVQNTLKQMQTKLSLDNVWYQGKPYEIHYTVGTALIKFVDSNLYLQAYSREAATRLLRQKFYKEARTTVKHQVSQWSQIMGLRYKSISLKDQKTRWGSCSSKGNLNFSWRLIMTPASCLQYVVIHELAHIKHLDHSQSFWLFVEQFDPEYREHRRWLRRHEAELAIFEF